MELKEALNRLTELYALPGTIESFEQMINGHINSTYRVKMSGADKSCEYIFQKINTYVFREPLKVMRNIKTVSGYLSVHKPSCSCGDRCSITEYIDNRDGQNYTILEDGSFWRISHFVANSIGYEHVERPSVLYNAGYAFGDFIGQLSGVDPSSLEITIPDFHNTKKRLVDFFLKVDEDPLNLAKNVKDEIEFFRSCRSEVELLCDLAESGELPTRVVHNDTKYNNILIDIDSDKPLCVIDLDTMMPGLTAYDFGDAIRFAANTAHEDEADLSKVALNLDYYERFASGFIKAANGFMTDKEFETLAVGAPTITVELASRFLLDYLDGDKYFSIHRPNHNLDRARCQIALAKDMFKKLPKMEEIIKRCR